LIDLLIEHAYVLTMTGEGAGVIQDGTVAVDEDKIVAVGKSLKIPRSYRQARMKIDARGKAVLPGFIDAHTHSHLIATRGESQDIPESEWWTGIAPFSTHMTEDVAIKLAKLGIVQGVKAGTTLFGDFGPFMDAVAEKAYAKLGVRANLATMFNELRAWYKGAAESALYEFDPEVGKRGLRENLQLIDRWQGKVNGRISCCLGPQAPDMMSKDLLLETKRIALERNLTMHFHLAQGATETAQMRTRYGMSSIRFLDKIDFLCPNIMAVHCESATDEDLRLIAERGLRMISCPSLVAMTDGLVSPVWRYLELGGRAAALGSDSSLTSSDMFKEVRMAALLNKVRSQDPTALPAWRALRLATIEAARTLGLEETVGSIEPGKKADLIVVGLTGQMIPILNTPIGNIVPNLVYSADSDQVETVIVDGRIIMENRTILKNREDRIAQEAQKAAEELADNATKDYEAAALRLSRWSKEGII